MYLKYFNAFKKIVELTFIRLTITLKRNKRIENQIMHDIRCSLYEILSFYNKNQTHVAKFL